MAKKIVETTEFNLIEFKKARDFKRDNGSVWLLSTEDLISAYRAGERDFDKCTLEKCILVKASLANASFKASAIDNCRFVNCDLTNCNFSDSNITYIYVHQSKLDGVILAESSIAFSQILTCSMENVKAGWTSWRYTIIANCQIIGANFESSSFNGFNCENTRILRSDFSDGYMDTVSFDNSKLIESDFSSCELGECLIGTYIEKTNILDSKGIYFAYGPHMSSRQDALYASITIGGNNKLKLRFWAGCAAEISKEELIHAVDASYTSNDIRSIQYHEAITFIKAMFVSDMAAEKWDYLLTFEEIEFNTEEWKQ